MYNTTPPRRSGSAGRLGAGPITPGSTPRVIANHLAAVANDPMTKPSFQSPYPRANRPRSPVTEELAHRARSFTPDYVLMKELETQNQMERGSALRVDDAIIGTTRARDESERVMAEVLTGIERSFTPNDDKRLVCRAYVVQLGRTAGRLRESTARLEREAADALRLAATEKSDLLARLHHMKSQSEGNAQLLATEIERAESERAAHNDHMHGEFERMRRERDTEAGRLGASVSRLNVALESSRGETNALWTQAQQQQRALTMECEALRASNASLTRELELSRE